MIVKTDFRKKFIILFYLADEIFWADFENRRYLTPTQVFYFFACWNICVIISSIFLQSERSWLLRRREISAIFEICPKNFVG